MAANIWKIQDMYSRIYYYEDEKKFNRRFLKLKIDQGFALIDQQQRGYTPPAWWKEVKGYRVINDVWVEQTLDEALVKKGIEKREVRQLQATLRKRY